MIATHKYASSTAPEGCGTTLCFIPPYALVPPFVSYCGSGEFNIVQFRRRMEFLLLVKFLIVFYLTNFLSCETKKNSLPIITSRFCRVVKMINNGEFEYECVVARSVFPTEVFKLATFPTVYFRHYRLLINANELFL
jgi:hypothetical protein